MEVLFKKEYQVGAKDFVSAGEVSANIKRQLKKIGIEPYLIRKIAIASYEAEINMIIHSYGGVITIDVDPDTIKIVCSDTGPGIPDINLAMKEGYSTASEDIRSMGFGAGMGLPNMNRNTNKMDIKTSEKGTTITMIFNVE